jgi:hypothetical protein
MVDLIIQEQTYIINSGSIYDNVYVRTNGILIVQDASLTIALLNVSGSGAQAYAQGTGYIYISGSSTGSQPTGSQTGSQTGSLIGGSAYLYNSGSIKLLNVIVVEVNEGFEYKNAILSLPLGNKDILQGLGLRNKRYRISGEALSNLPTARTDLFLLNGTNGYISTAIIPMTPVMFYNMEIVDKGGRPFEFKFQVEAVEII